MKKKVLKQIGSIFLIIIGCALAAFAIGAILIPNLILDGGINGISIMLAQLTKLKPSLFIVLLNLPFILLGLKSLGKEFVLKALFAMLVFSGMLLYTETLSIGIQDKLLATVYGGLVLGIGVGLIIRYGGCLDGTEIAAIILSKKSSFSVGILTFNLLYYFQSNRLCI